MELDDPEAASSELGAAIMLEDTEPLPQVIGSEPWHSQVPEVSNIFNYSVYLSKV